jgi:hypothetical protein
MADPKVQEIDAKALAALIERIEEAIEHDLALSVNDMKLLLIAITTLCTLQSKMEQDDITLHKLRKLLGMIKQSERHQKPENKEGNPSKGNKRAKNKSKRKCRSRPKSPKVVFHKMQNHKKGEVCPGCHCGKLYKYEPSNLLRITGHARYEAIRHVVERVRCNACQQLYKAPLPDEVLEDGDANQQYGYSARSLMVIDKFYSGTPYYHQSNLANIFGCSISASTIFDQCELVANDVMPVFNELKRLSANAYLFLLDDTHNRILRQKPEMRDKPNGKGKQLRTGVYSSGLIAPLKDGNEVILFETSLGHAGEHLDHILSKRDPELPAPITMSDALSSNHVTKTKVIQAYCNAHARRQFFDLEALYPKDIDWLLEMYSIIWANEDSVKAQKMDNNQRLAYHKEHSLPAMKKIKQWALDKQSSAAFEEHSVLGKAIRYFLKHYDKLVMFCAIPGVPIDNNRMEEKLKILIRGRKTAHFYKTVNGAGVSNVLVSIIATANQANENIFEYLIELQKNKEKVKEDPGGWLPWNYRDTLEKNSETVGELLKPEKTSE